MVKYKGLLVGSKHEEVKVAGQQGPELSFYLKTTGLKRSSPMFSNIGNRVCKIDNKKLGKISRNVEWNKNGKWICK